MVVNHEAGDVLLGCVASLRAEGVTEVTVVDNASSDRSAEALVAVDATVRLVQTGTNLGYGTAANRGLAVSACEFVLVSNPDVVVHPGALAALVAAFDADPTLAIAGPTVLEPDGSRYPSARRFPSLVDAAGHALLGDLVPQNPFTRRYRMGYLDAEAMTDVDWVSGACFLARRRALEELGGFDESYFMYAEDTDLCWRARPRRLGGRLCARRGRHPCPGDLDRPPALPHARRPSPVGLPLRHPDRAGVAPAGPAADGGAPGPASGREVRQAGLGGAPQRLGPGRVGLAPDHGQGR